MKSSYYGVGLFIFLGAVILSLLFNIYIFQREEGLAVSLCGWISSSLLLSLLLMLFIKVKWVGFIFLPLLFLIEFAVYYIYVVFGIYVNFEIVASILETNIQESIAYVSWLNIVLILLGVMMCIFFIHYAHKYISKSLRWPHFAVCGLLYGVSLLCFLPFSASLLVENGENKVYYAKSVYWPWIDVRSNHKRVKEYIKKGGKQFYEIMSLPSMASAPSSCVLGEEEEITIILHIGESVRADHLPFNGYERNTFPLLMKRRENIISFAEHYSFGLVTRVSLVGMLTDAELLYRQPKHAPFFDLFNKHGYETAVLLPHSTSIHDFALEVLTKSVQHKKYIQASKVPERDKFAESVSSVREMLSSLKGKKRLIVFYDSGAHVFFGSFPWNKKFLPDSYEQHSPLSDIPSLMNAYDNNLLEIDKEMDSIICSLESQNALFIHVSDHGVALGEEGLFGSGNTSVPVRKPAFFIWMSDVFLNKHAEIVKSLNSYRVKPISHDYLLHTILSLGGIRSILQKKELDLTHPAAQDFVVPASTSIWMSGQKNSFD